MPASRRGRVHAGEMGWTPGQRKAALEGLFPPASGTLTGTSEQGKIRRGSTSAARERDSNSKGTNRVMVMGLKAGQQVTTSPDVENPLQHPGARPLLTTHLPIQN